MAGIEIDFHNAVDRLCDEALSDLMNEARRVIDSQRDALMLLMDTMERIADIQDTAKII